jgi:hypothetical protein
MLSGAFEVRRPVNYCQAAATLLYEWYGGPSMFEAEKSAIFDRHGI